MAGEGGGKKDGGCRGLEFQGKEISGLLLVVFVVDFHRFWIGSHFIE